MTKKINGTSWVAQQQETFIVDAIRPRNIYTLEQCPVIYFDT